MFKIRRASIDVLNKNNRLTYKDYILDVKAAKFLVAKWNSDLGDAYLGYLLEIEEKAQQLSVKPIKSPENGC